VGINDNYLLQSYGVGLIALALEVVDVASILRDIELVVGWVFIEAYLGDLQGIPVLVDLPF
jgi:hypothetical protein